MNKKIKELAPLILEEIKKADHILLNCHRGPDGDSLGGSLAMHLFLKSLDKKVTHIIGDSDKPKYLASLPGYDLIIDKNFFKVDLSKIDLFITIDTASLDQISRINKVELPKHLKTVVIDHHKSNMGYGDINLIDETAVAASQVVFYLLKEWGTEITPDMAANLFVGMYTDSGGFKYELTSKETFEAAAEIAVINPDFGKYIFNIENSLEPSYVGFLGLALSNTELFLDGKLAIAAVSHKELEDKGLLSKEWSPSDVSTILKSVSGWDIGVCIVEKDPGVYGASFRTRDAEKFDLSLVSTLLGGGGHAAAAGAAIKANSKKEAMEKLEEVIKKTYPKL